MLDPRIYRMGLLPIVLAIIVVAFSLGGQQGPVSTNLVPDAFNGSQAYSTMLSMAHRFPQRRPGSSGDRALAGYVAGRLKEESYRVSEDVFSAPTADGERALENVVGVRAGGGAGSIVIVSHRDALSSPATADLSGTAVMLQLAQVLAGQTQNRTLVLASTSGSAGAAGALRLASRLSGPVDAVIALGDLTGSNAAQPIVTPWSGGQQIPPPVLINTVGAALTAQTGLTSVEPGLGEQLAHLAFPMSGGAQAPFINRGDPAVLLSLAGGRSPASNERPSSARIARMGRAVLQAVGALQAAGPVPSTASYLVLSGNVVPAWAVRLLTLVLILPVLAVAVDGAARARRRGQIISPWIGWVLAAGLPFVVAAVLVVVARATGWIGAAPSFPVEGRSIPLGAGGTALLVLMGLLILVGLIWVRPLLIRTLAARGRLVWPPPAASAEAATRARALPGAGAAAAVLLVMSVLSLVVWVGNPFAALLLVPALHLWLWVVAPDVRVPGPAVVALFIVGLVPLGLVAAAFASSLNLGPVDFVWSGVLLLAGGGIGFAGAVVWSLLAGSAVSVAVLAWRLAHLRRPEQAPVTVRGPVSYAGPGSLGGTESALRR